MSATPIWRRRAAASSAGAWISRSGQPGAGVPPARGASEERLLGREAGRGKQQTEDLRDAPAQNAGLGARVDRRLAESAPFVNLGDFHRRLVLPGDWAWAALSPPSSPLLLLT